MSAALSDDLATCLEIRRIVFIEEQNVPEDLERDAYDQTAAHFLAYLDGAAVGTARVVRKGNDAKIGRVAVLKPARGTRQGQALIGACTDWARSAVRRRRNRSPDDGIAPVRARLVIMVKEPRPGRVKTRLGKDIGLTASAWWFRHQTRALLRRIEDPRWETVLAVAPDREGLQSRIWPAHLPRIAQGRGDLGDRMGGSFWPRAGRWLLAYRHEARRGPIA